jgi:hypothetical protein
VRKSQPKYAGIFELNTHGGDGLLLYPAMTTEHIIKFSTNRRRKTVNFRRMAARRSDSREMQ